MEPYQLLAWKKLPKLTCKSGHQCQLILYDDSFANEKSGFTDEAGNLIKFDIHTRSYISRCQYLPQCSGNVEPWEDAEGNIRICGNIHSEPDRVTGRCPIKEAPYFKCFRCEDYHVCEKCMPGKVINYYPEDLGLFDFSTIESPPYWENHNRDRGGGDMRKWQRQYPVTGELLDAFQVLLDETFKNKATRDRAKLGAGDVPERLKIIKVLRQENLAMWLRYNGWKQMTKVRRSSQCTPVNELDGKPLTGITKTSAALEGTGLNQLLDADVNETYLFHGTSAVGAKGISLSGFHVRGKAGSHVGLMFGLGGYLAEMSSKGDEYASGGEGEHEDHCCMLLCRATLGEMFYITKGGPEHQSTIEDAMLSGKYDSLLGDREAEVGTYREFVVRHQEMIYPEYVIMYERIYKGGEKRKPQKAHEREA